ncbi:bacterial transcriptional activator domain-containing protein [Micromonospora sp. NPDC050200]|uniref:AfsR/SARP family transcriptional regulator n=1 Tax=Micromonospora sp. NPDC050200 TaxID=3155664 RepID=UPI0033BFD77B
MSLPSGSWTDLGLALAIAAAVALVWAHRQRRYIPRKPSTLPRPDEETLAPMPRVVGQIRRALRHATPGRHEHDEYDPADERIAEVGDIDENRPADGTRSLDARSAETTHSDPADVRHAVKRASGHDPVPVAPALAHPLSAVWPPAGLGLTGPGAQAAARGFLTAALAADAAEHPDARTRVVMPSATAATLLGAAAVTLPRTPRLTITAGLDDALDILEAQTLHRTRLAYQHEVDTVSDLRAADPYEEPLPPVMLLADATGRHERARIAALLTQGQRLDIHGVLLGAWPDGNTIDVADDGATTPADGDTARHGAHPADVGRLAVINPTETLDLLTTLTEAHTGQAPAPAPAEPAPTPAQEATPAPPLHQAPRIHRPRPETHATDDAPAHPGDSGPQDAHSPDAAAATPPAPDTSTANTASVTASVTAGTTVVTDSPEDTGGQPAAAAAAAGGPFPADTDEPRLDNDPAAAAKQGRAAPAAGEAGRVTVTVLGEPGIVDGDPQRTMRAKSLELLVYLAVRDGSAPAEAILDELLPDAPASKAVHRLHTYVSDLRSVLRHNGGPGSYLTHPHHRYQLNPDRFTIDLWQMRAAIRAADTATGKPDRVAALRRAVDTYRQPLAQGCAYEWLEPYREAVRQEALDAAVALVEELHGQPSEQLAILDTAIPHHPHAEGLYQAAMRARAHLGDLDAVRALRRMVTRRLADIDAEPTNDTLTLADRLIADLRRNADASGTRRPPHADGAHT